MYQVILASNSPRRKEILEQVGIPFTVTPSKVEEVITRTKPYEVVLDLSMQKAQDVASSISEEYKDMMAIVIGADTVVSLKGGILGKPKDKEDARQMLSRLQGNTHSVFTGVSLVILKEDKLKLLQFYEETKVEVYPMSSQEIETYLSSEEYKDKAGSYGIQGKFGAYIKGIQGDYYNVVGFPIARFIQELKKHEINAHI